MKATFGNRVVNIEKNGYNTYKVSDENGEKLMGVVKETIAGRVYWSAGARGKLVANMMPTRKEAIARGLHSLSR